jgi:hypothetical protein
VTQSENRAAVLQAIRLYLKEQSTAAQTPRTYCRVEPSAPPLENTGEDGGMTSIPDATCVVCMDEKASNLYSVENFVQKVYYVQFLLTLG